MMQNLNSKGKKKIIESIDANKEAWNNDLQ